MRRDSGGVGLLLSWEADCQCRCLIKDLAASVGRFQIANSNLPLCSCERMLHDIVTTVGNSQIRLDAAAEYEEVVMSGDLFFSSWKR